LRLEGFGSCCFISLLFGCKAVFSVSPAQWYLNPVPKDGGGTGSWDASSSTVGVLHFFCNVLHGKDILVQGQLDIPALHDRIKLFKGGTLTFPKEVFYVFLLLAGGKM
jgi:hypothetical protein